MISAQQGSGRILSQVRYDTSTHKPQQRLLLEHFPLLTVPYCERVQLVGDSRFSLHHLSAEMGIVYASSCARAFYEEG